jgi:hypothetical protein
VRNICTGSYDIPVAHLEVDGVYTNKATIAQQIIDQGGDYAFALKGNHIDWLQERHRWPGLEAISQRNRIVHNAYRVELAGESLRKRQTSPKSKHS